MQTLKTLLKSNPEIPKFSQNHLKTVKYYFRNSRRLPTKPISDYFYAIKKPA